MCKDRSWFLKECERLEKEIKSLNVDVKFINDPGENKRNRTEHTDRPQDFIHLTNPMPRRRTLYRKMAETVYLTRRDLFSISVTRSFNKQQEPDTCCTDAHKRCKTNIKHAPESRAVCLHVQSCHLFLTGLLVSRL